MAISKKRAPVLDDPNLNRALSQVYDDINEVINAVNQGNTSEERKGFQGKSGDIRLAKESDGSYEIQGRTDEGWAFVAMSFKEK
jgi:hypothetical protein|tara:strand:- start:462 stop:713 length:252 start_codon:yes stop_codon:yes gene_type:complete